MSRYSKNAVSGQGGVTDPATDTHLNEAAAVSAPRRGGSEAATSQVQAACTTIEIAPGPGVLPAGTPTTDDTVFQDLGDTRLTAVVEVTSLLRFAAQRRGNVGAQDIAGASAVTENAIGALRAVLGLWCGQRRGLAAAAEAAISATRDGEARRVQEFYTATSRNNLHNMRVRGMTGVAAVLIMVGLVKVSGCGYFECDTVHLPASHCVCACV